MRSTPSLCRAPGLAAALTLLACAPALPPGDDDAGATPDAASADAASADRAGHDAGAGLDHASASDAGPTLPSGIEGRVCAPSGDFFIADAEVTAHWWEDRGDHAIARSGRARSGPGGVYRLRHLPVGHHTIEIRFGRMSMQRQVEVLAPGSTGTNAAGMTEVADACFAPDALKLAVVTGVFDSVEDVIDALGFTDVTLVSDSSGWQSSFFDLDYLAPFDAVYFNCGLDDDAVNFAGAAQVLQAYVAQGGSVYASDWAYFLVESAYPSMVEFFGTDSSHGDALLGAEGLVTAQLHGQTVEKMCGRQAEVSYDYPFWAVAESAGSGVEAIATGSVEAYASSSEWEPSMRFDDAPLMARHQPAPDSGSVVFTTFHNEAQATGDMVCILKYVILSL